MRILILHNFYQHLGGEDTVVQQEADALSQDGHQVEILTVKNCKGFKGLVQYFFYPFNISTSNRLFNKIIGFRPDIVHIHNLHYALGPFIIRKLKKSKIPVVMTLHNFRLICPSATLFYNNKLFTKSIKEDFPWTAIKNKVLDNSFIKTFITAYTYWIHKKINTWNTVDKYFTFSDFSKNIFEQSTLKVSNDKFVVKPNFSSIVNVEPKIFNNHFLYIGRLSEEKGIIPLLEAISQTKYTIRVFGSGPQENSVLDLASKYPNIEYLGFQDKTCLSKEIRLANALIVPSVCYEGMPMTIIEAFSFGTPVLCSNIGILKQMVVPLQTGLHFNPYSSDSIIGSLMEWENLDNESKKVISKQCIDEFQSKYTKEENLRILNRTYQQIITENEYNNYRPS